MLNIGYHADVLLTLSVSVRLLASRASFVVGQEIEVQVPSQNPKNMNKEETIIHSFRHCLIECIDSLASIVSNL